MAPQQANGYYPRLNAAMVSSGKFNDNIVSLMGRFISGATDGQHVSFQCSDGGTLSLSVEHADFPNMDVMDGPVVEVVGQVMKENEVALFVTRELSKDTDLQVYDKMIAMQHNPKFAQYFAPIDGNVAGSGSGMTTN